MVLVGGVMILLDYYQSSHILILLIPSLTFFITHYFLLFRRAWLAELLFLIFCAYLVTQNFLVSFENTNIAHLIQIESQRYQPVELPINLEDQKNTGTGESQRRIFQE